MNIRLSCAGRSARFPRPSWPAARSQPSATPRILLFTEDRSVAESADLYFTAGALQYIEEPFGEILGRLKQRPRHVILHRVPMQDGEQFVTLQNNGTWLAPYKVMNESALVAGVTALGYELVNQWPTFRNLQVLQHPFDRRAAYKGMYFRMRD